MSSPTISRRRITRSFKSRGLTLQAAALDGIVSVLQQEEGDQAEQVFTVLLNECKQRASSSPIVTTELLASVVANLARTATDVQEEAMQVLNAFETPQLQYDVMRKAFSLDKKKEKSLFGDATDKVSWLRCVIVVVARCVGWGGDRCVFLSLTHPPSHTHNLTHALLPSQGLHAFPTICTRSTTHFKTSRLSSQARDRRWSSSVERCSSCHAQDYHD